MAPRDIRAPRGATFDSASLTEAAARQPRTEVQPITELIKSPADNQEDQLAQLRRAGAARDADPRAARRRALAAEDEVARRLATDAPEISLRHRAVVAEMCGARWEAVAAAAAQRGRHDAAGPGHARTSCGPIRDQVRDLITTDLEDGERALAGDLAAALVEPNVVVNEAAHRGGARPGARERAAGGGRGPGRARASSPRVSAITVERDARTSTSSA